MLGYNLRPAKSQSAALVLLLISTVVLLLTGVAAGQEDFTIIVLPDPQNYSEFRPDIFKQQTQWIADNQDELNIKFVIGVGDNVNDWDSTTQWQNADAAIDILDNANIPYAMAIGNHDYDNDRPSSRQATQFNKYFGPDRYAAYPWYQGQFPSGSNESFYATFSAGGSDYLVLALEMHPRSSTLEWARSVVRNHALHRVIVVTHSYMHVDHTRVDECDTNDLSPNSGLYADPLWYQFIREEPNIMMAHGGHITGSLGSRRVDRNNNGEIVHQLLQNYQDFANSGDGWLRIYKFRPSLNQIEVKTYSPFRDSQGKTAFLTDSENQFTLAIAQDGASTSGTGTISGRVRPKRIGSSSDCTGISGARVSIPGASTTSDSSGFYSLSASAPSTQTVTVERDGWGTQSREARVWNGFTERLEFILTASTSSTCSISTTGVKICSPSAGATVSSPVRVTAAARHASGIKFMQIYLDGTAVATVNGFSIDREVSMNSGARRLTVQAKANDGTTLKQTVNITVSGGPTPACTAPSTARTVKICAPVDGATVSSPVHISAVARPGASAIQRMEVWVDGVKKLERLNTTAIETDIAMSAGTRRVTVQAADSAGTFKTTVFITVPSESTSCAAPSTSGTINICAPADGSTVSSPVRVWTNAFSSSGVEFSQVYVDGIRQHHVESATVDVSLPMAAGTRRITVQSQDNAGVIFKKTVFATVL